MDTIPYVNREIESRVEASLRHNPATAILGPRQCGKSTLVKYLLSQHENTLYLDLERPSDLQKLADPEWFLSSQIEKLVCLDEIQRKPEIFPLLRSLIDESRRPGMYLLLGSASRDLLQQSSESLAGRISFKSLSPFLWREIASHTQIETYLVRGGFPLSLLAPSDQVSYQWRQDFANTFLERDLLQFGGFSPTTMRRLWQMLAHSNGQTLNYSALGSSLGVSHTTIRNYVDLLEDTFMIYQLRPFEGNTKKRLVKSPKVYLADTGITTSLLSIRNFEQAIGNPAFGALWETLVLANLRGHFPNLDYAFYRTNHGVEIDIVISNGSLQVAVECKASLSPNLTKGNHAAIADISPVHTFVASPMLDSYPLTKGITVTGLDALITSLQQLLGT